MEAAKRRKQWISGVYVLIGVFDLWLASRIPYTHDDWDWGLAVGWHQLISANINSRYAGNFAEVVMTRSEGAKTLLMGGGYFVLPYLIARIAFGKEADAGKRVTGFIVANLLILTMDRQIWRQTYGWVAGFANFSLSACFMLAMMERGLSVLNRTLPGKQRDPVHWAGLFALSLCGQLFLENLAIFMVLFCLLVWGIWLARTKTVSWEYTAMTAGALVGLGIMFSSRIYGALFSTGTAVGGYRRMIFRGEDSLGMKILSILHQAISLFYKIWENNLALCLCILFLLSVLSLRGRNKKPLFAAVNSLISIYFILNRCVSISPRPSFTVLVNFSFFLMVGLETILLFHKEKAHMFRLLAVWASAPAVIMPLALITETGARLFFTSNILLCLFAVQLLTLVLRNLPDSTCGRIWQMCLLCAVVLFGHYGRIYYDIGQCKFQREALIAEAVRTEADGIVLPAYPHGEYLWEPDPTSPERWGFFRDFYGIPADMDIQIESLDR